MPAPRHVTPTTHFCNRIVFESFKELCLSYQRGEWDAETFYDSSCGLLGDAGPVLRVVALMPDEKKRAEVLHYHAASCAVRLPTAAATARQPLSAAAATTTMPSASENDESAGQPHPQQHDALPQRERKKRG